VIISGNEKDETVKGMKELVGRMYMPNTVIIRINPSKVPTKLAELNGTVKALIDGKVGKEEKGGMRVCEGGVCGTGIYDLEEARKILSGT
jgi:hypothetical protein